MQNLNRSNYLFLGINAVLIILNLFLLYRTTASGFGPSRDFTGRYEKSGFCCGGKIIHSDGSTTYTNCVEKPNNAAGACPYFLQGAWKCVNGVCYDVLPDPRIAKESTGKK